jgi:hypothetical protein
MSRGARTEPCDRTQASVRLAQARKFLEMARRVGEEEAKESLSVSAALAVLSGIAASDAACCAALGRRSRSQDHQEAIGLVSDIVPGGPEAAKQLQKLRNLKDTASYGTVFVSRPKVTGAIRQAGDIVDFAGRIVRR